MKIHWCAKNEEEMFLQYNAMQKLFKSTQIIPLKSKDVRI